MSLRPRRVDFDSTWSVLLETVKGVITCGQVQRATWNDRFSDVYALCVANPEPLGDRLYQETKNFLENHVRGLNQKVLDTNDENLLTVYQKHWEEFGKGSGYLNQLYGYLNTTFIKKQKFSEADLFYGNLSPELTDQMLEIGELALDTWKKFMIEPMKKHLMVIILQDIKSDRHGNNVSHNVLHGVINSFVNVEEYKKKHPLQLYEELFEGPFLKETGDFYRQEAAKLKDECTCSEYMEKVIMKLDNEDFRSRKFLHPSSYNKVTHECQQRMVADHLQFLHGECWEMVKNEKRKDLSNMYSLLKPIHGGLSELVREVEEHIKSTSLEAVKNLRGDSVPSQFVENMLDIHGKYTELIANVFRNDQHFVGALDKACATAINHRANQKQPCRSPELLAKYCDNLLKKSSKGSSETELDDQLASCITVFKYIDDKDVFQRYYAKMLARRLIHALTASIDAEELMVNKLKQACGYEFTNKLQRMLTDMKVSEDLNENFISFLKGHSCDLGLNTSILVLQAGSWPIGQSNLPTFAIPQELEKSVSMFEDFYNKKYSGRKLTWIHSSCSAELKFSYLKKPYIVTMGCFQMAVLLLFNISETVSYKEILAHTELPDKDLAKQVQSLIDVKLLSSTASGMMGMYNSEKAAQFDVNLCMQMNSPKPMVVVFGNFKPSFDEKMTRDTALSLNMGYYNKRTKFKITAAVQKETTQEVEQTRSAVDEDRKMYIQAAIVRIMKARRIFKHNLLIQEVISQAKARFVPNISMIKKCIEALIEKQYIERTQKSTDEYCYVA